MKILLVEDQAKMSKYIKNGLTEAGYTVDAVDTAEAAEKAVKSSDYELVILDVMLPDGSGFDSARRMRTGGFKSTILMLTALDGTKDKVNGLDAGADDYLTKPFEFDELLARVRALARRQKTSVDSILRFADVEMDLIGRTTKRAKQPITLTPKEFSLLEYFLRNPNRPIPRAEISEHVWDTQFDSDSNVIDVYINMLRKKVDQPFEKKLIQTVVGAGYALKDQDR